MRRPAAVFLDFDGVVLESLDVKARAMAELFADRPEHVDAIVKHHLDHAGVSRYEKFRHYYAEFFKEALSKERMAELDVRFSELCDKGMQEAPFVPGALEFLRAWHAQTPLFVVSGAPQRDVEAVVEQRGLGPYFRSVHGSPLKKAEHLAALLRLHGLDPARCVFVGDARADQEAAAAAGMAFIQRLTAHTPRPFSPPPDAAVPDLRRLAAPWETPPTTASLACAPEAPGPRGLKGGPWVYAGRDMLRAHRWQKALGPAFRRVPLGDALHAAAGRLRGPYAAWLDAAGREHDGLAWWSSQIAEENMLSGSLFTDLCLFTAVRDAFTAPFSPVLVVAEEGAFLDALEAAGLGRRRDPLGRLKEFARRWGRLALRWAAFSARSAGNLAAARLSGQGRRRPALPEGRRTVLLHTCIERGYFSPAGTRDAYFGTLASWLRARGCEVVTLPWLFSPGRSRAAAYEWLRGRPEPHIIPEDYYGPLDYVWAARVVLSQANLPARGPDIPGAEQLLKGARHRQACNADAAPFVLYYRLVERLAAAGFLPKAHIDLWENSLVERPVRLALRRFMPGTSLVGYQHFLCPPPLWLQGQVNMSPASRCPQPDVIVCNSPMAREALAATDFPPDRLLVGASLRHSWLAESPVPGAFGRGTVFVGLSLDPSAAMELLSLLAAAFPDRSGLSFNVKPHPMMPASQVESVWREAGLPETFSLTPRETSFWMGRCSVAVAMASSVGLDMALAGVPTAIAGRDTVLDFDPLAHFPDGPKPCRTPASLRSEVLRLDGLSEDARSAARGWAIEARKRLLVPSDDASMQAFLPPDREARCAP